QLLTPQRTGLAGVDALNATLQAEINPRRDGERPWKSGKKAELRPRDRIIQTVNNYSLGVMNGEVGEVVTTEGALVVDFEGRRVTYDAMSAMGLELAYALTIHKTQGSEFPWVVVICHSTHAYMLSRQLLYTAI